MYPTLRTIREQTERPPARPRRRRDERRSRLIETAIRLFSERPYEEVSVQEIAEDAGVATGLLYYHFKDKQGLYAAGLELLASELRQRIDEATDPSKPPLEQLMAGMDAHLRFVAERPTGYRELLRGAASQPKVSAIVERERAERLDLMIEGLPEGVEPTPLVVATLEGWLHFADGVQIAWLQRGHLDRDQVGQLCSRVLFGAVLAAVQMENEAKEAAQSKPAKHSDGARAKKRAPAPAAADERRRAR